MAGEPYRGWAWVYRHAGWPGVIPLPPRAKTPPPRGYTGWAGVEPSGGDIQAWVDGPQGDGNVALHFGPGLYGLDVDDYGGKSGGAALMELAGRLGPLPATWIVSSRGETISGIRVFRAELPAGRRWRDEPAGHGAGIEAIHRGHRYAVVAPSVHPETGAEYQWRRPTGELAAEGEVPPVADLPALPAAWIAELSEPGEPRVGDMAGHHETVERIEGWRPGEDACLRVDAALGRAMIELAGARDGAALHPSGLAHVHELVNLGHEGHAGVRRALAQHFGAFVDIRSERDGGGPGRRTDAEREWWRMVRGAVGKLPAATHRDVCDCALWAGEGLFMLGPPTWAPAYMEARPAAIEAHEGGATASFEEGAPPSPSVVVDAQVVVDPVEVMRGYLLTSSQIAQRDPPRPLVAGLLYLDTLAWLIGRSGSFKSFVALDLAQAVGHGRPWAGRRVRQGPVLYIVAEGAGGMSLRTRAWALTRGPLSDHVHFLPHPVQVTSEHWGTLVLLAATLDPALIVIDTQARVTVGIKENDNTEMGRFIEQVDRLRRVTRACVLIVHHIGRQGEDARGASAIDGAQDTELKVSRVGGDKALQAQLKIDKQKDGPDTAVVDLELLPVDLGELDDNGEPLTSLVVSTEVFMTPRLAPWREGLPDRERMIIDILDEMFGDRGGTRAEVMRVLTERGGIGGKFKASAFYAAWKRLDQSGRIVQVEGTQRFVIMPPPPAPNGSPVSNPFTESRDQQGP